MKKRFLTIGLLMASLSVPAQRAANPTYTKQTLSTTDIQLLFSYYGQDGSHSAVTGGLGTEELTVYAPEVFITHRPDSIQAMQINAGVDVITSASTDNIDFVRSSASRVDRRGHLGVGYSRRLRNPNWQAGVQSGFSIESDYFSVPVGLSISHQKFDASRKISVGIQTFFDDLRWGRVNPGYFRPIKLIYPVELRYREWFDKYRRTSFNLTTALYQVINRKAQLAMFAEVVYQRGLLSTPFHRVYFNDRAKTEKVEYLPDERWKIPLGAQFNWFMTNRLILRSYYRFYWDTFGISSHTVQADTPLKLTSLVTLTPLARFYCQRASPYFRAYGGHDLQADYYTSDYDLSALTSYKLGLSVRYAPQTPLFRSYTFQSLDLQYSFYKRSDGLSAHIISLVTDFVRKSAGK